MPEPARRVSAVTNVGRSDERPLGSIENRKIDRSRQSTLHELDFRPHVEHRRGTSGGSKEFLRRENVFRHDGKFRTRGRSGVSLLNSPTPGELQLQVNRGGRPQSNL